MELLYWVYSADIACHVRDKSIIYGVMLLRWESP